MADDTPLRDEVIDSGGVQPPVLDLPGPDPSLLDRPRRPPIFLELPEAGAPSVEPVEAAIPGGSRLTARPRFVDVPNPPRVLWRDNDLVPWSGVYDPDGRRVYADTNYPWACVAKVLNSGSGSGALVGPRHVLTASHVIDWNGPMETVLFTQGGVVLDWVAAAEVITYKKIDQVDGTNADDDYAVIVLERSPGLGWLGTRTYDSDWDDETDVWKNISYAPAFGGGVEPVFQTGFFLDEEDWDFGRGRAIDSTTLDCEPGMSGSPVFGFWSDGPYVIGVVSAGTNDAPDGFNIVSGGSNLTRLVREARDRYP
jgi:V8-like Glu-specific endopeptidase